MSLKKNGLGQSLPKRNKNTRIAWVFGESTAQGTPFGSDYAAAKWAATTCNDTNTIFINLASSGQNSASWWRLSERVAPLTKKGDHWILIGGHNEHFYPPSGPFPPWNWVLWIPLAKWFVWPFAQWEAARLNEKTDYTPNSIPYRKILWAFDPIKVGRKFDYQLSQWGKAGISSGASIHIQELIGCSTCSENLTSFPSTPTPYKNSRGYRHTEKLNRYLFQLTQKRRWNWSPLPKQLSWKRRTHENRLTLDNHHPDLNSHWTLGHHLALKIPTCKVQNQLAPPVQNLISPELYLKTLSKAFSRALPHTKVGLNDLENLNHHETNLMLRLYRTQTTTGGF